MPAGRPTKYDPAFCDTARDFLAEGYSIAALAGKIGVATSTVKLWVDEHTEFSAAVKEGQAGAVLWWEQRARKIAKGEEDGNATVVIFGLKNRASDEWKDKREQDINAHVRYSDLTEAEIDAKLAELQARHGPPEATD